MTASEMWLLWRWGEERKDGRPDWSGYAGLAVELCCIRA